MATCEKREVVLTKPPVEYVLRLTEDEARIVRQLLNTPLTHDVAGIDEALRAAGVRL